MGQTQTHISAAQIPFIAVAFAGATGHVSTRAVFDNGYGMSVIRHGGSYGGKHGRFEVAVLNGYGELDYTTKITGDVIGWCTAEDVQLYAQQISEL